MKNLVIALFLLCTFNSQAQSWEAKIENAQFQVKHNNYSAYSCVVKKNQGLFSDDDFERISKRCLTKDGIFRVALSQDKSMITVFYLDWIDHWTINWLFSEASPALKNTLRIHPQTEFSF